MKDNPDLDSWFSAKPIIVGNFSNILAGTELHLRQDVFFFIAPLRSQPAWLLAKPGFAGFAVVAKNTSYSCTDRGIVKILPVKL